MKNIVKLSDKMSFCSQTNVLRNEKGEETLLENIECKVLTLLITYSGQVVVKAELLNLWNTAQNTSDNSLTYALSKIRKKLNTCDENNGVTIKSIRKKGYMLLLADEGTSTTALLDSDMTDTAQMIPNTFSNPNFNNKLSLMYFIALILFAITIFAISALSNNEEQQTHFQQYYSLFEDNMRKYEIAPSDDGQYVIFSGQRLGEEQWILGIYNSTTMQVTYIERNDTDLTAPTWFEMKD